MTVIEVRHKRGQGCCEKSLVREVLSYYSPEGRLLAESDPVAHEHDWVENRNWNGSFDDSATPVMQCVVCNAVAR